jgi:hypothetical protein
MLSEICRIQFRFVDGSSIANQFDPNQKLMEVRDFVAQVYIFENSNFNFKECT